MEEVTQLDPLSVEMIDQGLAKLEGDIIQIPPMFSAVKVNGRRLYDYARAGETVERPKRDATIYEFKRTSEPIFDAMTQTQTFAFKAVVSKGTYIRTLAVDFGKQFALPSVMSQLTRQSAGGFTLAESHSLADVATEMEKREISMIGYSRLIARLHNTQVWLYRMIFGSSSRTVSDYLRIYIPKNQKELLLHIIVK
ncbi:tRNA pseudouridine synthase B [Weissella viridescens]|uniref:tRNA pseudouridine(55) synthase n=1 Tax=Weissella viridescens TaxID=1629 RepID=A0A380PAF7_WEIVI|nr:tRNA pseudouridine synthase B [Weissella viridescens]